MFPQNYSLLGLSILEELGNKQTDKLTGIPLCFIYTIDKLQYLWTVTFLNVFIHTRDKKLLKEKGKINVLLIFMSSEGGLAGFPATLRPDPDFLRGVLGVWHM